MEDKTNEHHHAVEPRAQYIADGCGGVQEVLVAMEEAKMQGLKDNDADGQVTVHPGATTKTILVPPLPVQLKLPVSRTGSTAQRLFDLAHMVVASNCVGVLLRIHVSLRNGGQNIE